MRLADAPVDRPRSYARDVNTTVELVRALAWPAVALTAVVLLRHSLRAFLAGGIRRMKAGPLELEWDRELVDVQFDVAPTNTELAQTDAADGSLAAELGDLANRAPTEAIAEAHRRMEQELLELLEHAGAPPPVTGPVANLTKLARAAMNRGVITPQTLNALEGLSNLRDLARVHPETATPERALGYLVTADTALWAARQNARSTPGPVRPVSASAPAQ